MSAPPARRKRRDPINPDVVLDWLRVCWPPPRRAGAERTKRYPDEQARQRIVEALQYYRGRLARKRAVPPLPVALNEVRAFIRHSPQLRASLEGWADMHCVNIIAGDGSEQRTVIDTDGHARTLTAIDAVDIAIRASRVMLDAIKVSGFGASWPDREPARVICAAAQEAWLTLAAADPNVKVPRAVTHVTDPLVKFVHLAQQTIGIEQSRSAVSAILSGKRRR